MKATHLSGRGTAQKLLDKCHANAQCVRERVAQLEDFTKVPPALSLSVAPLLGRDLLSMAFRAYCVLSGRVLCASTNGGHAVVWSDLSVLSLVLVGGRR